MCCCQLWSINTAEIIYNASLAKGSMAFKCPFCNEDDPMTYVTKQHLEIHIRHMHPEDAEFFGRKL